MALHDFYGLAYEDGAVGLAQGVWGGQRIISVGYVGENSVI